LIINKNPGRLPRAWDKEDLSTRQESNPFEPMTFRTPVGRSNH